MVACEDAQLVLAAAGSGKTLCLLAKIEYAHYKLGVNPQRILAISFTKKTVAELQERCAISGVEIRTFHSLGNKIISESNSFVGFSLISEAQIADFIAGFCSKISPRFKKSIETYFAGRKYEEKIITFRKTLTTFLSLFKSGMHNISKLRNRTFKDAFERDRTLAFLEIFEDFYRQYQEFLRVSHYYDFSDMINAAIFIVRRYPKIARGYRYVLLDEVQDLSKNRAFLIREILRKNPSCKFFAVGDD